MWIISGPRVYLAVFIAGMFVGFGLGVHAKAAEAPICVDVTTPIMPYCDPAKPVPMTGCTYIVDGRPHLCFTPTKDQAKKYRQLKGGLDL